MKIVVIGGTGLVGSQVVQHLAEHGHDAIPASPNSGVNTITGEGLAEVLVGANVVVDVSNSPSFADADVLEFFTTSTGNLIAAEREAGVTHHVALSIVGAERLPDSGYLRAKVAQEKLIEESGLPFSIVRATQFYEFMGRIADAATVDGVARVSTGIMQPIAAADVAIDVARVAANEPLNGTIEIAGPERLGQDELVRTVLAAAGDSRDVVSDPEAQYFGTTLSGDELSAGPDARLATTSFGQWLDAQSQASGGTAQPAAAR
ncbi:MULTISPECIES: SDR family oxidoreductase [unclassified Leifsonia]|uniref:SDR family oxidoreductase n=1 Tax=unclassified Leifsonia TaxID=2663824 RepID=UPI0006F66B7C|nr:MULTISPECIES: SDR family oxidoreductase [unclassified Leifsonia]KQX05559.1 NmrA family transcriptional regulator [Leifsonia sp. Root1293]KRA09193.1 NmrA family transcriptional regulator [Leifsonia sp. Root60]